MISVTSLSLRSQYSIAEIFVWMLSDKSNTGTVYRCKQFFLSLSTIGRSALHI